MTCRFMLQFNEQHPGKVAAMLDSFGFSQVINLVFQEPFLCLLFASHLNFLVPRRAVSGEMPQLAGTVWQNMM